MSKKSSLLMHNVDTSTVLLFPALLNRIEGGNTKIGSLVAMARDNKINVPQLICGLLESYMIRNHSWSLGMESYTSDTLRESGRVTFRSEALEILGTEREYEIVFTEDERALVIRNIAMDTADLYSEGHKIVTLLKDIAHRYIRLAKSVLDNDAAHAAIKNLYNLSVNLSMVRGLDRMQGTGKPAKKTTKKNASGKKA